MFHSTMQSTDGMEISSISPDSFVHVIEFGNVLWSPILDDIQVSHVLDQHWKQVSVELGKPWHCNWWELETI